MGDKRAAAAVAVLTVLAMLTGGSYAAERSEAAAPGTPDYSTAEAGNPFVDGSYADPDTAVYNNTYWVFATSSRPNEEQTYLDAFSSADLIHWTKHPNVLTTASVSWARRAVRAPAPIERNGKYFLYFAANDIQSSAETGGIGVAVADRPEGPYVDALGKPLIGQFVNGAQPIDQDVFIDADGQAYMYYGGRGHANVVKLNADMTSLGQFADGSTYKEITPSNYTGGAQMFKRNGKYYFMWSDSGSYAMSDSPTGPFTKAGTVLPQDPAVATGSGHNGVINVPGTDIWYLVYPRRPLGETDADHRELSYDRMSFNADGTIQSVTMRVKDNFADGNALGWTIYAGSWSVSDSRFKVASSAGGKAMLDTNFADLVYDAEVTVASGDGDAGVVFRATRLGGGADSYHGYYAGLSTSGRLVLGKAAYNWTQLASVPMAVTRGTTYHLRVEAIGSTIKVYAGDMSTPKITVKDASYASGADGVRVSNTAAGFGKISLAHP
jgi:hypothetical protein